MLLNSKLVINIYMPKYAIIFGNAVLILNFKGKVLERKSNRIENKVRLAR